MFSHILSLPDSESLFPTHLHRHPTHPEAKPMQCRHIWRYLQRHIPKSWTSSQVGASKSGLTQPGSRRASQFCDSAIRQTGQGVVIEMHSILSTSNTSAILSRLHRSVQSVRLTPSPLVSMLTLFCVGVVNLIDTLVYRVGIRYRSPISGGIGRCVVKRYTPSP